MFWMRNKENSFKIHTLIWRSETSSILILVNHLFRKFVRLTINSQHYTNRVECAIGQSNCTRKKIGYLNIFLCPSVPRLGVCAVFSCVCATNFNVAHNFQGSNLALANLLNASSFLQKASRNCHHLLFLACENKSLSYQPNYATQHMLYGKQCRS